MGLVRGKEITPADYFEIIKEKRDQDLIQNVHQGNTNIMKTKFINFKDVKKLLHLLAIFIKSTLRVLVLKNNVFLT